MSTHLVIPDPHGHPDHHNKRADYLGRFILDLKPDVVINLGDMFDMPSMNNFDTGRKTWGRDYQADINAGCDFDDRLWHPLRHAKKKRPRSIFLVGNHEQRMSRILNDHPEFEGFMNWGDYDLERNYHEVVPYDGDTPGICFVDGVAYAHYHISGVMGKAIGGVHQGSAIVNKVGASATMGHTHTRNFFELRHHAGPTRLGLVAGVYQDYNSDWAGVRNAMWWRGVVVKRNVENGVYDHQWISLDALKKEYS